MSRPRRSHRLAIWRLHAGAIPVTLFREEMRPQSPTPWNLPDSVAKVTGTWEPSVLARISSRDRQNRFLDALTEVPVTSTARMMNA